MFVAGDSPQKFRNEQREKATHWWNSENNVLRQDLAPEVAEKRLRRDKSAYLPLVGDRPTVSRIHGS